MAVQTVLPDLDTDVDVEEETGQKTRFYKQYVLLVHNDDDHTIEYVVNSFKKVFRYTIEKCIELASRIHNEGMAVVFSGLYEHVELKKDQLHSMGPDIYGLKRVEYPLLTEIREM